MCLCGEPQSPHRSHKGSDGDFGGHELRSLAVPEKADSPGNQWGTPKPVGAGGFSTKPILPGRGRSLQMQPILHGDLEGQPSSFHCPGSPLPRSFPNWRRQPVNLFIYHLRCRPCMLTARLDTGGPTLHTPPTRSHGDSKSCYHVQGQSSR